MILVLFEYTIPNKLEQEIKKGALRPQ